jgi:hypothetical protein
MEPPGAANSAFPDRRRVWTNALFGCVLVMLAGSGIYSSWRLNRLEADLSLWRAGLEDEVSRWREMVEAHRALQQEHLEALRGELAATRIDAFASAGHAKAEAERHAERLARQLAYRHEQAQQQVARELARVKQTASDASATIAEVRTQVVSAKTEVAAARSELHRTAAGLQRVTGDMGVLSGLIATNARELAALREIGDRNYFAFDISRGQQPQQVGGVRVALKRADPARKRYTIVVHAGDWSVEKKDRLVNEPVQFYLSPSRIPWEIVVNEVAKDRVAGYLAAPKVELARR